MKTVISSILSVFTLFMALSLSLVEAEEVTIAEVSHADFEVLAQNAAKENKQLMIVYYRNQCKACEQLVKQQGNEKLSADEINQHYKIYKTNTATEFDVVCPNGEIYAEEEFLTVKGIRSFPAVVITDKLGNVEMVENSVTTSDQILQLANLFKAQEIVKYTKDNRLY